MQRSSLCLDRSTCRGKAAGDAAVDEMMKGNELAVCAKEKNRIFFSL
jgi:hypothetical protein